jgi:ABC-type dipeptide/oligopeptide/nickel transport system permease subunit
MAKVDVEPIEAHEELEEAPDIPKEIIGRSPGQLFWRRFRKDKFALAGIVFLIIIAALAITAPAFAGLVGHPYNKQYIREMTSEQTATVNNVTYTVTGVPLGPTFSNEAGVFLFGADTAAHDLFIRVLYGARTSLIVALSATAIEVLLGVTLGIMAGYYRGKVDTVISRLTDIFYALPTLLLILGLVSACFQGCFGGLLQPGLVLVAAVIGLFGWPYIARIIRGQVLSLREKEFVESARALGAGNFRIMFREILPNCVSAIIVYSTLLIPTNILIEASLSFLGIGVPPTTPSWGGMLSQAASIYRIAWWTMIFPGVFLFLTTLAFNLVGDGLRDAFDPKTA